jgi:RNA polymerase sigma-70 factor (ECF subfamily)
VTASSRPAPHPIFSNDLGRKPSRVATNPVVVSYAIQSSWAAGWIGFGQASRSREKGVLESSDLDLARLAGQGDHQAFHALVDRHAKSLFRVASRLSPTRSDAEDLVQDTFAAAYKGLAAFDGRASVKTWLTRILIRRAADAWRAGRARRQTASLETAAPPAARPAVAAVDQRLDLATILAKLEPAHREVIVMREMQGMSYAEIAESLNVPQGTVESRLHRARAELRRRLTGYSEGSELRVQGSE